MLLRSSSSPILNSRGSLSKEAAVELDSVSSIRKTQSMVPLISASSSSIPSSNFCGFPAKKMSRARSEADLRECRPFSLVRNREPIFKRTAAEAEESPELDYSALSRILSSAGLAVMAEASETSGCMEASALIRSSGNGDGGGRGGGRGGGSCGNDDGGSGWQKVEFYYNRMIKADPGNSLLLSNYAKFLKGQGDLVKAEAYCARSILEDPSDGEVLSLYGDLIWQTHKDAQLAKTYFEQAVKAAPESCYVMASYANFLWNAGEQESVNGEDQKSSIHRGAAPHQPPTHITAAP